MIPSEPSSEEIRRHYHRGEIRTSFHLLNTKKEQKNITITLGELEVMSGIEDAIQTMKLHEVSTFKLSPPFTTPGESKHRLNH